MKDLGIVVPCYNEEESIDTFYHAVANVLADIPYEIWFINDGSSDTTLVKIKSLSDTDKKVHYISFSRNFGKEAALLAGLEACDNELIVTMDVDLQDPPELLEKMYEILQADEYDAVMTRRTDRRGEPAIRSWFARLFYKLSNKLSAIAIKDGARDYCMMKSYVKDAVISDKEYNRFTKGIYSWVGFNVKWLEYDNVKRDAGKTKWSFFKLCKYAVNGIMAFSTVPLMIASFVGVFCFVIAILALLFIVIRALLFGDPVAGWPSLVSIILLLGSLQLLCMGIIGLYVGKIYLETKQRPHYIIKEKK